MADETDDLDIDQALAQTCSRKERAFVREMIIDQNATQSVMRCGCFSMSVESARTQGARMMARPHVRAAVDIGLAQRASRATMTAESVLHEMTLLSHSDIGHYVVDDDGHVTLTEDAPEGAMRAIKSVKRRKTVKETKAGEIIITYDVELTLWDKPDPLKLMGRNASLFPNKVEVSGPGGKPIEAITRIERAIVRPAAAVPSVPVDVNE